MSVRWPRVLTPTHLVQILKNQKNPSTALRIFHEAKEKNPNYGHNGPVYATMIGILDKSGRIREMREIIEQMKDDSCECKDTIFASAIQTFARVGRLNEAMSLFESRSQFNCVNWTHSFNTLLKELIKASKLEAACRFFLENSYGWEVKSRVRSLNMLMEVLCVLNRSDLASQIFQEMDYQGCYPDRESYRILMDGLCKEKRLDEATHLLYSMFWRISQKGAGEDIVVYRILLDALCKDGKVDEAVGILSKILRKGLKAPKRCHQRIDLSQWSISDSREVAKQLINEALIRGAIPSSGSYSSMATDLYAEGKIADGDKVLDEMKRKGFWPRSSIYEAKIDALCREGRVEEAMTVVDLEMMKGHCVPTVGVYNILIRGLCDEGNCFVAIGYLKKMAKKIGCVANEETYAVLVSGLCREGNYVEASKVAEEMLIKSHRLQAETYDVLIKGLCCVGRRYEAVMWLEEMVSQGMLPASSVWTSLAASVCCGVDDTGPVLEHLISCSQCI